MIKKVKLLFISSIICTSLFTRNIVKAVNFTDNQTVDSNKIWTVKFTGEVGFDDATKQGITVTDSKGNVVHVGIQLGKDSKTVMVTTPQGGYIPGENYILNIGTNTHSKVGKTLKNEYNLHFNIKSSYVVTFKNKNLEQAVRNKIDKPTGDIYKSSIENITSLDVSNNGINDIGGIENLTNLQVLNLSQNQISDPSALQGLTNLRDLDLSQNQISDISGLQGLSSLYYLILDNNQISDISALKSFSNLRILFLNKNQISDISALQRLTNLQQLSLKNNRISDISTLEFLSNLKFLYLAQNLISDYSPVKGYYNNLINKDFDLLDVIDTVVTFKDKNLEKAVRTEINKLTGDIYKSDVEKILSLQAWNSEIQYISGIESLTNLQLLDLSQNQISDINELEGLTKLQELYLDNNQISDITALEWLTKLQKLSLNDNRISDISTLEWLTNLKVLYLAQNHISDYSPVKGYYDNLTDKDFKMSDSNIPKDTVIFKDENLEQAVRDKIDKQAGDIYKSDVKDVISLDASDKDIKDISGIENLINLQTFDLSHNQISNISVLNSLTDLQTLNLNYNGISDISALRGLSNLQALNLNNNVINDISSIQGLNSLKSLNLSNNKIIDISALKGLTNLQTLWLNNNKISDADKERLKDILSNCNIYYNSSF